MEDNEIVELYFARNESAIGETAGKYGRLCCSIANRILGDEHEADECVNDTYLGVWQAIPPARPDCLRAFIAKIARNLALTRLRRGKAAKRRSEAIVSVSELEEILPDASLYDEVEARELGEWISEFLRTEKEEARKIFLRKYWFFDSVSDISEKFGCSESKVKSMLFHTRMRLREYLTEKGVAL